MAFYTDQLDRSVEIVDAPQRIISLVPSQTELLYDLDLDKKVIGITKFCIHPESWFRTKTRIGGTKTVNLDKIKELQPDLIIANKEENVKEQIDALANDYPVWISDVNNLSEALNMIAQIGVVTNRKQQANILADKIKQAFTNIQKEDSNLPLKTAYLIWKDPYMSVGRDTFINDILSKTGYTNIFATQQRYPSITIPDLQAANCEVLFLSSEPFPFKQKHIEELQAQLPHTKILLVDGEAFSWYGSRLLHTPAYLQQLQVEITALT